MTSPRLPSMGPKNFTLAKLREVAEFANEKGLPIGLNADEVLSFLAEAEEVRSVCRDLATAFRRFHGPFDHDYVKDEKRCAECRLIARYEALGAST